MHTADQAFGTVGGAHSNGNIKQGQPQSYLVRGLLLAFNYIQQARYVCEPVFTSPLLIWIDHEFKGL
jgi:hypothetical protein